MIVFALLPLILLTIAALNFLQIRTPKANSNLQDSVDVVVPMRNEAENVEGLVASLSAQDGPFHFYLLDDNSEDSTYELLQRFTTGDPRFTIIKGAPLADGWLGKTWALQQLYEASNKEVLVSIDADVRLTNEAINKVVTLMHGARLDFVSPYPRQIAENFAERLIQPLLQWLREHIHHHGQRFSASRLVEVVTGKPLSDQPLTRQLNNRFRPLYGI